MDLISIIVPIYNAEKVIKRCIESISRQSYEMLEIILVDDGSTDQSLEICEDMSEKDSRIKIIHQNNGGVSRARNTGLKKATGQYIMMVDSDDYLYERAVELMLREIKKNKADLAICGFERGMDEAFPFSIDLSLESSVIDNREALNRIYKNDYCALQYVAPWAKLYARRLFDNIIYPEGKIFEDIGTTYLLMLQCEKIAVGYQSKYNYIFHDNSIVNSKFKISKLDMIEMTDKMATDVLQKYPDMKDAVMSRRVYSRISTLNQMINEKGYLNIKKQLMTFIYDNAQCVLKNKKVPKRDKIAICLLRVDYNLYKIIWKIYRK